MTAQPPQPVVNIFQKDSGGNSTVTRLDAEIECNRSKGDLSPVVDSSLTYGDLRLLHSFIAEIGHPPDPKGIGEQ